MRKTIAAWLMVFVATTCSAEDIALNIRSCTGFTSPAEFVRVTALAKGLSKAKVMDGLSYFRPRDSLRFDGLPVVAVFGFDDEGPRRLFPGSPVGTQAPRMYGVTVEATQATGAVLVRNAAARSDRSQLVARGGHEYADIFCYVR